MSYFSDDDDIASQFTVPTSLTDFSMLLVLTFLAAKPQFLGEIHVPSVNSVANEAAVSTVVAEKLPIELHRDGSLWFNEQKFEREHLVRELSRPEWSQKRFSLRIDTTEGQGPLNELLALQVALGEAQLGSRVGIAIGSHEPSTAQR